MPLLFTPLTLPAPDGDGLTLRNRAIVAPMCQYVIDAEDGVPTDWHLQHLGSFAAGGFGLVTTEATGVEARGRISPRDVGLYTDAQQQAHQRLVRFIHSQGAAAAVQLAHAGGKASTYPWLPGQPDGTVPAADGGWQTAGVADAPVLPGLDAATALSEQGIAEVVAAFAAAARRADAAGYDAIQLHAAHGYLMHQFLSPLTNTRIDGYGGDEERRTRLVREVAAAVRAVWPAHKPLGIRISATDWVDGGWDVAASARLLRRLATDHGVTWVDVSSGGLGRGADIAVGPGYQVTLAAELTRELAGTPLVVSTVGLIDEAIQAETILASGQAHAVSIGRAALRDPHWAASAASRLGVPRTEIPYPPQYWRANW
ncbi:2,4-dienoyl-CoA reductase-like NADH-dependent reductase (Old Yellow Enzyme family) [Actinoplanes lutulentus]|uniref:2,4-dienoyl-CoA reductase-like NADH-dependent reductase (Old Yellow Enzyme family) n=1 Tax=Actinoplanes lutulentus TaxID=1287878 RepID=A0A327ZC33_9ACTN|nr:NADH:flavin oxidoreductase/NADH oxidase [Actinoplanes lutulentus]MBB2947240.1 2,4-dienoyl-CoA reductase-like NADH-dependent reductase (Old Yellow Enzyme family) [Actinoplanes lutulentus]RAK36515.1 2,4-dienoyl-CoA reductase-like NADH-dependent reductase (Old Yellow Enzyme family) [Actinoplanes lutulentus]